jgi:hypothetical protein
MNKNRRIYRQAALERLLSPEQLDRVLRITKPRNWVGLMGVYVIFGALLIWGMSADLPVMVQGLGVIVDCQIAVIEAGQPSCVAANYPAQLSAAQRELRIFIPALQFAGIQPGVLVRFQPFQTAWNRSEYILARVTSVSDAPLTRERLDHILQGDSHNKSLMEHGPVMELRASFMVGVSAGRGSVLTSNAEVPMAVLVPGTTGEVRLVAGTRKPITIFTHSGEDNAGNHK